MEDSTETAEIAPQVPPAPFEDTAEQRAALWAIVKRIKDLKKGHYSYLAKKFNISRAKATEIYARLEAGKVLNEVLNAMPDLPQESQGAFESDEEYVEADCGITNYGSYVYNEVNDKYIVPLKTFGGDFVCPGAQHKAMLTSFSNWNGQDQTYQDIARTYKMHINWVKEYFKVMGWTHANSPITDEEIKAGEGSKAIDRVFQVQKAQVLQELQTRDWEQTQKDALKWRTFKAGKYDPLERLVSKYVPTAIKPLNLTNLNANKKAKHAFIVGLSDLHFGGKANSVELYSGSDFNAETIEAIVDEYATKIAQDLADRTYKFEKCVICVIGDILHTLTGFTEKGTRLESSVLREDQYELAFNVINRFINRMHELFGAVELHVVKGNHTGPSEYILFDSLRNYYRTTPTIQFNLYRARAAMFNVLKTAILLDHGDSEYIHAKVPNAPKARQAYVQNRFLQHPEKLAGMTSKIMIQGDMHHYEQVEFSGFEFFMFSSPVTGDRYADHLGCGSRPRQNCLILDEDGVKEVLHYYFDC